MVGISGVLVPYLHVAWCNVHFASQNGDSILTLSEHDEELHEEFQLNCEAKMVSIQNFCLHCNNIYSFQIDAAQNADLHSLGKALEIRVDINAKEKDEVFSHYGRVFLLLLKIPVWLDPSAVGV